MEFTPTSTVQWTNLRTPSRIGPEKSRSRNVAFCPSSETSDVNWFFVLHRKLLQRILTLGDETREGSHNLQNRSDGGNVGASKPEAEVG